MFQLPSLLCVKAFVIVSQYLSFTKAAEVLHVTQGAVSRQIKQLEDSLGVALFIRDHHSLRLTAEGKKLLPYFTQSLEKIIEGISMLQNGDREVASHLALNLPPSFSIRWLAPRLISFCQQYPDTDLTIMTEYSPEGGFYDFADAQVRFGTEALSGFHSMLLFKERNVLVGNARFREQASNIPRLLSTNALLHILNGKRRLDTWEHWLALTGLTSQVDPSGGLEFSTQDQAITAAVSGIGLALLDRFLIRKELEAGELVVLSSACSIGPYGYWLDIRPEKAADERIRNFCRWILEQAEQDMKRIV